ncbi:hypothetical protein SLEP1_g57261 [Rubroshorea leprosula]|uniref:Protein kinase domain-containing protein n=1 Tax=Rubroshorea leprosula TaxID=152421 RepID=A0AAV5MNI3_9ROSI|nr:hypothetical protein SLEP1_g57261 [Rubroshorea leprosula]
MDFTKLAGEIGTVSHTPPSNPVDIIGDSHNYCVAGEEANNMNTSQRTQSHGILLLHGGIFSTAQLVATHCQEKLEMSWQLSNFKVKMSRFTALSGIERGRIEERQNYNMELQLFELDVILKANNNFSLNKKLGDGSFGPIYKGTLLDRKDIAVKRLSGSFVQGLVEFKNEVALVSKLQHWNLVKLL